MSRMNHRDDVPRAAIPQPRQGFSIVDRWTDAAFHSPLCFTHTIVTRVGRLSMVVRNVTGLQWSRTSAICLRSARAQSAQAQHPVACGL